MSVNLLPIILVVISISLIWVRGNSCLWVFTIAASVGLYAGWIEIVGIASILLFGANTVFYKYAEGRLQRTLAFSALLFLSVGFAASLFPGFNKFYLFEDVFVSPNKSDVSLYFKADKVSAGFFLLWLLRARLSKSFSDFFSSLRSVYPVLIVGILGIYALGMMLGFIKFELTFHAIALPLLINNLFFVVIAEEGLFRGILLDELKGIIEKMNLYQLPLLATSVLFGLVHYPGGWKLILLATLAGLLYGYCAIKTRRIDIAILSHTLLNAGIAFGFYA